MGIAPQSVWASCSGGPCFMPFTTFTTLRGEGEGKTRGRRGGKDISKVGNSERIDGTVQEMHEEQHAMFWLGFYVREIKYTSGAHLLLSTMTAPAHSFLYLTPSHHHTPFMSFIPCRRILGSSLRRRRSARARRSFGPCFATRPGTPFGRCHRRWRLRRPFFFFLKTWLIVD